MKTYRFLPALAALSTLFMAAPARAALPLQPEQIVVTCFSGTINYFPPQVFPNTGPNGYVVAQFDTTTGNIGPLIPTTAQPPRVWNGLNAPPFSGFHNETGVPWTASKLGEVFGIAVDDAAAPNIYVTATECYNVYNTTGLPVGAGGRGGVYRLDGTTGASSFGSLPNDPVAGPALGNVCFRRAGNGTGYIYVSNFEDGMIYRMSASGLTTVGTPYDHGAQGRPQESLAPIADDGLPGMTQFGRRIWGVKTLGSRLFYAVWWEDARNISLTESNEIWSVDLDSNGDFLPATARRRILQPNFTVNNWSYPVASIDFSPSGAMFLAERYFQMWTALVPNGTFGAHHTRILRYTQSGPNWVTTPGTTHHIGGDPSFYFPNNTVGANSAGGVAVACDESIWATGDMYAGSYGTPPNAINTPGDLGYVYGAMRIPSGGNSALAGYGYGGFAIDFDGQTNNVDKFSVGAVATVRECCIPPPADLVGWWPLDELNGATVLADLSGAGNNAIVESGGPLGSFQSPSAAPGFVAGSVNFIDNNSRGRAPNAASLNFGAGSFSFDCWFWPVDQGPFNRWQPFIDKFNQGTLRGYTVGITNYVVGPNNFGRVAITVGGGSAATYYSVATVNFQAWNFVGIIVDRAANTIRFNINGVIEPPIALTVGGNYDNTLDLLLGAMQAGVNVSETRLDEIELFNRALGTNEISAIWAIQRMGKCKQPGPGGCTTSIVTIICPPNTNVACAPVIHYPPPFAATTCGTITNVFCVPPSGGNFPPGPTVVTCYAIDSQGNSNSCSFTITAAPDVTPPVLDCMCLFAQTHEILMITGCEGIVPDICRFAAACASDDCCLRDCAQSPPPGTVVGPGVTMITLTITDCAGNMVSCMLPFSVTPPPGGCPPCPTCCNIICPTNLTVVTCGPDAIVNYPTPMVSSNCGPGVTITCTPPSGSVFPLGTTTVTCTGTGGGGGALIPECRFSVTVVRDPNPWTLNCPPAPAIINVTGCPPVMPNILGLASVTTNCPLSCPVILSQSPPAGTPLTPGFHPAIITACDCFDLCRECTVVINAVSTGVPPTIMCPPNQVLLTCSNSAKATYKVKATGHTGPVVCTPPSGTQFPLGTTVVMCMVTNNCGTTASCTFTVTVKPQPNRWLCGWHAGIGIPFEHVGGATTALRVAPSGVGVPVGPGLPAVCIIPNPALPATPSGILLQPGPAQAVRITTMLDFEAPLDSSIDLAVPAGDPLNPTNAPILSFKKSTNKTVIIKFPPGTPDNICMIARNTNGLLLPSVMFTPSELTNPFVIIGSQPGVSNCHVTVELNLHDGGMSIEFDGPVVPAAAGRKGWDGCIYGPDRPVKKPAHTSRIYIMPPVSPGQPPITGVYLLATGLAEVLVEDPALTALGRKWSDGHVTLMKAYDDGESGLEFRALADGGGVHVDLGHSESFDFRLTHFESGDVPTEEQLLTRTIGPIALTNRPTPPPFLDALLCQTNPAVGGVDVSADFSNLDSPTVRVQIYNGTTLVLERAGAPATLADVLFTAPGWPLRLGKLGGATPCRRGKPPFGAFRVNMGDLNGDGTPDIVTVMGDEFRVLAELPPGAPHPDYYEAMEFITTAGADWGVYDLQRTPACPTGLLNIAHVSDGVQITWSGANYRLQGAEHVAGPWYDLGAASPVALPAAYPARFFRLACD